MKMRQGSSNPQDNTFIQKACSILSHNALKDIYSFTYFHLMLKNSRFKRMELNVHHIDIIKRRNEKKNVGLKFLIKKKIIL